MNEETVGLRAHLSKTGGIGGTIKKEPEDFLVEEITPDGTVLEIGESQKFQDNPGDYVHFTLQKTNWGTMRAVKAVARACGVSRKRLKFAGTKDRRSVSAQRVSAWKVPEKKLEKVRIKDIVLRDFAASDEQVGLGGLKGNRFTVTIREVPPDAGGRVEKIIGELGGKAPNFFGTQRFGIRLNNHLVGKSVFKGDFKGAAMGYLCDLGDEPEEATEARKSLRKTGDFKTALRTFPKYLGFEKSMLNYLVKHPTDFIGALRVLPKKLRKMLVHSYQGYVFNLALSRHIEGGDVPEELPLVGYGTEPDRVSAGILEREGMSPGDFKVPSMPEMSLEGEMRRALVEFKGFEVLDFNEGDSKIRVRFSLPPGAYATMLLRELMK